MRYALVTMALVLSACASAHAQRTWRDVAQECYAAVEAGRPPAYQGRRGLAACDRYVEDMRHEQSRRDAMQNARDGAILQHLLRDTGPPAQAPPPPERHCTSFMVGNQMQTVCR